MLGGTELSQSRARELRRKMSPPEVRLWVRLRARSPGHPVFRRQHPCGPYILDFYCDEAKLAVEVDGWGHNMGDQPQHDARRTNWLRRQGIEVLRLTAADVLRTPEEAAQTIWNTAAARIGGRP